MSKVTIFSERDGPFGVKIEPTNGHEFSVRAPQTSHEHHHNQKPHVDVHLNQMFKFDLP
jgi:hypothetical protein